MNSRAKLYCFLAQKRSGHHAVISWLAAQLPGKVYQLNNPASFLTPFVPASFERSRTEARVRKSGPFLTWTPFSLKELTAVFRGDNCLCINHEEFAFRNENSESWAAHHAELARFGHAVQHVLVYRDPYNMCASRRVRRIRMDSTTIDQWKDYARMALGLLEAPTPVVLVNYNRWFHDVTYRKQLSATFGVIHSDVSLNFVPYIGHGSSFDGLNFQDRAQEMSVSDRWRGLREEPAFRELLSDAELADYSRQLFHFDTSVMKAIVAMTE